MKNVILKLAVIYLVTVAVMVILKPLFLIFYPGEAGMGALADVVTHGFSMDLATAGYLTAVPALILIASQWLPARATERSLTVYFAVISFVVSVIAVTDLVLYGYWGFRLDMTPVFYFTTSPRAALASATAWEIAGGIIAVGLSTVAIFLLYRSTAGRIYVAPGGTWRRTLTAVILAALLFIPIRGGFTVSTMNLSRAYFSHDQHLNHAAVNPAFSLLYSATHQGSRSKQYTFMTREEAVAAVDSLDAMTRNPADSLPIRLLNADRPDVVMIILESFSSHLFPSLGGEAVAVKLDSVASTGWMWENFYANSFRTDRALTAIMSGFPGVPSTSLMKDVGKTEKAPSWPREMKRHGWETAYFYGGDTNFTNMHAYLVSQEFSTIVSDRDFPVSERLSKWGAHDDVLFRRAASEILSRPLTSPRLDIIQTSSSHEPFKVPYANARFAGDERLNAFAFTDSCAAAFIDTLHASPLWDNMLVIIVPDHYGVYPRDIQQPPLRHAVPLIFTGGALADAPRRIARTGSQADLAATILASLGIDHGSFPFSRNLLAAGPAEYAFFSEPSVAGLVTSKGEYAMNCDADATIFDTCGADSTVVATAARALLQEIYRYMSTL